MNINQDEMRKLIGRDEKVKMKFITIIPAYNEEKAIKSVVKGALKYSNVLVVDDGSTDNTFNLALEAGAQVIKHDQNKGKGAAIKTGLKASLDGKYAIFVFLDGDGQHNPDLIPLLTSYVNDAELVVGSRFKEGDPTDMPLERRLSNKITTSLIKKATGYRLTDSQSGFRAISSNIATLFLNIKYDDYIYESEMLYKASRNDIKIKEVAIPSTYNSEKSYVTKWHVLSYMVFVLKLFLMKVIR
jgi:glycosyltransferase involved in cell wall biosynthesis